MKKRKWKPWWWRHKTSCPDCGFLYDRNHEEEEKYKNILRQKHIICPRCNSSYPQEEFFELNHEKYSRHAEPDSPSSRPSIGTEEW